MEERITECPIHHKTFRTSHPLQGPQNIEAELVKCVHYGENTMIMWKTNKSNGNYEISKWKIYNDKLSYSGHSFPTTSGWNDSDPEEVWNNYLEWFMK